MWNELLNHNFIKASVLCLLSIIAVFAMGIAAHLSIKSIWNLLTSGATKEFLTPEGRVCALIGGLFGILLLLFLFMPDLVSYLARMIDPQSFSPPKEAPLTVLFLLCFYFVVNIITVGMFYKHN